MAKRIKLKDLLDHGFLKPNEEVYMEFRGLHFSARVLPDGKFKTERGIFNSMPEPTFLNLMDDPDYKKWYFNLFEIPDDSPYDWRDTGALSGKDKNGKVHIVGGWHLWKTWNGTPLDHLRKKLVVLLNNPGSPVGTNIGIWQNHSDHLGEIRFYWGIKSEVEPKRKESVKNYFRIVLPHTKNDLDNIKNLMSKNFEVFDIEGNVAKQKLFDVDEYGIEEIIDSNYNLSETLTLEEFFRFIKKRSDQWSKSLSV